MPDTMAIQGVAYDATPYDYFVQGGSEKGTEVMTRLLIQTALKCSTAKIVLGGYR